ncbi:hypothetical protein MCEMSE15_01369 [Fimbriimonadaceae bacterium]
MRIISPFHDYYDTALGLGYDPSLIYRRELAVSEVRAQEIDPVIEDILSKTTFGIPSDPTLSVLGFCGRIYPMYLAPDFKPSEEVMTRKHANNIVMSREEVTKYFREMYGTHDDHWYRFRHGTRRWSVLDQIGRDIGPDTFRRLGAPIWLALEEEFDGPGPKTIQVFTNIRLANFEFQKHFDAFRAFQEIAMFLGSALAKTDGSERTVGSDEIIAAQKGFGPESFRTNAPSVKKSRRKENRARKKGEGN